MDPQVEKKINELICHQKNYDKEAYRFVLKSLNQLLASQNEKVHISGLELLDSIRQLAVTEFGPMAGMIFNHWGVYGTVDFGHIVFYMIEAGILGKNDNDSIEDFKDVYDFEDVFEKNYDFSC